MSKKNKSHEAIISVCQEVQSGIKSLSDALEEPLKSQFAKADETICRVLASLKDGENDESGELNAGLIETLQATQTVNAGLQAAAKTAQDKLQTTLAGMTDEVSKAVAAKVAAGELIEKATLDQKISDATSAARTAVMAEQQKFSARRAQLTTASMPVPADEALAGEDAEFETRKTAAAQRLEELKSFGLANERLTTLAWNTDAAAYAEAVALMKEVVKTASKSGGANGFINPQGGGKPTPKATILC